MKRLKLKLMALMLMVVMILPMSVSAQGPIDTNKDVTFTVIYEDDGTMIEGTDFDLYYVASADAYAKYTLTDTFSKYPVNIDIKETEDWAKLSTTLKGYVEADSIKPLCTLTTGKDGKVVFNSSNAGSMKPGIYLAVGHKTEFGEFFYTPKPVLVPIPEPVSEDNSWNYDVVAYPKKDKERLPGHKDIKVEKVWKDEGYESSRPAKVTVKLLCDGKVYDTVDLTKDGNWRHTWESVDGEKEWSLVEDSVNGYTVSVDEDNGTFVVTNTIKPSSTPVKPPQKLPQTGLLWWPVPMLIAAGLLFIVIGLVRKKKADEK